MSFARSVATKQARANGALILRLHSDQRSAHGGVHRVTNDLLRRVGKHCAGTFQGFTRRHNVHKPVYFEEFAEVNDAIAREKQIKAGSRQKKVALINGINHEWRDLFLGLL